MPKIVCDFEAVRQIGEQLKTVSSDMTSSTNTFKTKIADDLTSWTGDAKNEFSSTIDKEVEVANKNAEEVEKVATFIIEAATKIQDKETELAGSISI